jgi:hypothetical protein
VLRRCGYRWHTIIRHFAWQPLHWRWHLLLLLLLLSLQLLQVLLLMLVLEHLHTRSERRDLVLHALLLLVEDNDPARECHEDKDPDHRIAPLPHPLGARTVRAACNGGAQPSRHAARGAVWLRVARAECMATVP